METVAEEVARSKTLREAVGVVRAWQRQELLGWTQELLQEALERLVEEHLGRRWHRRRGATPWICLSCGPREAQELKRNGHYRRNLVVLEGVLRLRVPQLRCVSCGRAVALGAPFLPARQRFWGDLEVEIAEAYLSGASYRQVKALVERRMSSSVGLMSLWRRFQEAATGCKGPGLSQPLETLYLDEAYLRVRGKPYWGLLALGETSGGSRQYLGAMITEDRSLDAWQQLLEGLGLPAGGRGLRVLHDGDQAIGGAVSLVLPWAEVRRCVWHELQNLIRQVREAYPGDLGRQLELIRQGVEAKKASWPPKPRTTSLLERRIKDLRRRIRPMDGFGSLAGARNFIKAWLIKENIRTQGRDWLEAFVA